MGSGLGRGMELQTHIPLKPERNQISYDSKLLLMGSCFVENIGNKLEYYKFRSLQNPFGIIFQPKAIEKLLYKTVNKEKFTKNDLFFLNERWHCFDVHSDCSNVSKEMVLSNLNKTLDSTLQQLQESTHIIITLGTAWAYRYIKSNEWVANCHKVPQAQFSKELLSIGQITDSLANIISVIRQINSSAAIIFTISPVRHLKDGFVENQRSKSHLISSVHELLHQSKIIDQRLHYFPSYEIMMDELRDYRFYADDMVHPNQTAINYIWKKFKEIWIDSDDFPFMDDVETIQKGLSHKPFNTDSEQHKRFLKSLSEKIMYLQKEYPFIKF